MEEPTKNNKKLEDETVKDSENAHEPHPNGIHDLPTKKIEEIIKTPYGEMKRTYTFPKDGNMFNFAELKDSFMIQVNGTFWILYHNKEL